MRNRSIKTNVILNIIRTGATIVFPLIVFPYVSRVLGADNYGKVNFANSVVSYFALLASLGISNYAIREGAAIREKSKELQVFANQVFTINIATTVLAYVLMGLLLLIAVPLKAYNILILVQSLSFIFTTIGVEWLYSIYEDYFYITVRSLAVQVISLILMFMFVKTKDDYIVYSAITILSAGGANVFNFIHSKKYTKLRLTAQTKWKTHIKPMLIMFCNTMTITIYVSSDTTILGLFKGDEAVGIYTVAVKIYTIVKQVLNSIITVILPRASAFAGNGDKESHSRLLHKVFKVLISLVIPAIVGLFLLSKEIILLIAGKEYVSGYVALKILSLALGCAVFAYTLVQLVLLVHKQDKQYLKITVISAVINIVLNFIAIPLWGLNGAAVTTLIAELFVLINSYMATREFIYVSQLKSVFLSSIVGCVWIVLCCLGSVRLGLSNFLTIVVALGTSVLGYSIIQIIMKNEIVIEILHSPRIQKLLHRR